MAGPARFAALARLGLMVGGALAAVTVDVAAIGATPSDVTLAPAAAPVEARWNSDALAKLVKVIEHARDEGLNPQDYNLAALRQAMSGGTGPALDTLADAAALTLAHDYYFGRVSDRSAMGWMIQRPQYEAAQLPERLAAAVRDGSIKDFYKALLPADARYGALRDALASAPDAGARDRIRANMERWRWMPRRLGDDYLYVNVPSYRLQVIDHGTSLASYDVVVGAKDMPTPLLASPTSSLVVNPWWNVPASIVKRSNLRPGAAGFQFKRTSDGWAVRQPPGPRNALGRIKFNLINDQAIYLHDTPAKRAFGRDERALSHGCIRVKDIDQLAAQLMQDGDGGARLDEALANTSTETLPLPRTWQVYIVYFTMDADPAGGDLVSYGDPYGYDARIIAALDGRPLEIASR
ncbi:L,D-transpeptidase family protein [Sphingomonas nostoxanthinifaciens]|uniref:L,D-transpeptidase family protein n=1 Tax=Sphingomonas nostoxanthinifaciens TaxID=2872652 RepID=UPI001CC1DEF1|nr:L,D-transpeptidase family protein [Sphingomonas nostoxanthinifaciens]UAK25138.1 L,D-transpeptidase family protein [Sphingomonas nostoxanthinifaciens]